MIDRDALYKEYSYLISTHASRLYLRYNLPQYEAVKEAVTTGFDNAVMNYDSTKGAAFKTYAQCRMRGEVLDYIRSEVRQIKIKKECADWKELQPKQKQVPQKKQTSCDEYELDVKAFKRMLLAECGTCF